MHFTAWPVHRPMPKLATLALAALAALAAATMAFAAAGPGIARADSLVFVKGGAVYVAQPDGSQARAITNNSNGWAWPSETDAGIIAVAGGLPRVSNGFDPTGSDQIYEFDQQGRQLRGPIATEGTYSTVADPEYVLHFRVAPDNSNVAWSEISGVSGEVTSWRRADGSGSFSTADDSFGGPANYATPEWWGAGKLLITHNGPTVTNSEEEYGLYNLADGSQPGWAADTAIGGATSYQVAISHSGLVFAVMTDDGPDNGGTIHNISIQLETTATAPTSSSTMSDVTPTGCTITLPASEFASGVGSSQISMSFSSDGSTLAWGQDDGIYEANVSNPSNCGAVTSSVHRVVAGGAMPFLGAAALSAVAGAPNTAIGKMKLVKSKRQATFTFHASGGIGAVTFKCKLDRGRWTSCHSPQTYKHLKRGKHTFAVEAIDARGKADSTPATHKFTIK